MGESGETTLRGLLSPPPPVNSHIPVETRGMGAAPPTQGGEDGRGQKRGLRPSVREARPGSGALGSGGRVGATSRACPPSSPPRSQTASARGTGLSAWVTSAMRGPQLAGRATGQHRNRGLDRRPWANATALQGPGDNTLVWSDGPSGPGTLPLRPSCPSGLADISEETGPLLDTRA